MFEYVTRSRPVNGRFWPFVLVITTPISLELYLNESIYGLENLRCDERLQLLGLSRLESRRNRSDLIETFKTVNGHYNVNTNLLRSMTLEGGVIVRCYLQEEVDVMSGSMCLLTGL